MGTFHRIILGDARRMAEVEDSSVHLVVTSPPYWQLKDYGISGQIGFNDSYEDYINHLGLVWNECLRVLHPGCRVCINIGDQFARAAHYGGYRVVPIRTEIIKFFESAGADYMGAVIWRKVTTCNTSGGGTVMGSYPYPRNGILKLDYEFILIFRKPGRAPVPPPDVKRRSALTAAEWNEYFSGHWSFPGERQREHIAPFPEELPRRLIRMFTFEGETVLDPFLGSGTTSLAALNLGRSSIGYEINDACLPIIRRRLMERLESFDAEIEFIRQKPLESDPRAEISRLPYVFHDARGFRRIVDPRVRDFGSRVSWERPAGRELHSVREVLSPTTLLLEDGRVVGLLGVVEREGARDRAVEFLKSVLRGRKVFLKDDGAVRDSEGKPLYYVFLKNRTFVNAQMIKKGLAEPDGSLEHKHLKRFLALAGKTPRPPPETPDSKG
ncbi:MAG: DNA methyltransferase [Thermoplasmata archaeon]